MIAANLTFLKGTVKLALFKSDFMSSFFKKTIFSMSIAIFSMFFGAGNAIFPLILGMQTGAHFGWAFIGLLLTGIGGPLLGLLGGTLYRGDCVKFFGQAGKIAGPLLIMLSLALLGPLAVLPRCVTVAHAAAFPLLPYISLWLFAPLFGIVSLILCFNRRFLLPVLGYFLSPLLIGCLLLIIGQSFFTSTPLYVSPSMTALKALEAGISAGYDTMDLIASIFFSAGIWTMIEIHSGSSSPKYVFTTTLKAGILGCLFLALIYLGLTHAAAVYAPYLIHTPHAQLMVKLAITSLGPALGFIASIAVGLACLTTVISLVTTISQIVSEQIFPGRLSYRTLILGQLIITTLTAPIGFTGIMKAIHYPISIAYPLIIFLTIVNILFTMRRRDQLAS